MSAGTYNISGVALQSAIALGELTPVAADADWTFALADGGFAMRSPAWFQRWRLPGGRQTVSFARHPSGYLLRFHGLADFVIGLTERSIVCSRRRQTTVTTVRHLLLDQVMPLILSRGPRVVLHASAIATARGAVAFVGPSGSGKSTLAAALAAAGFPLLTDDCLVVERSPRGFDARPFYPGARLWPDSVRAIGASSTAWRPVAHYTRKRRIASPLVGYREQSVPLARVFLLEGPWSRSAARDHLRITRLRQRDAILSLLKCSFHLDTDRETIRQGFDMNSRLVATTLVDRLSYPWRLGSLSETRDALVRRLEEGEP
jgi:hypothetical protein